MRIVLAQRLPLGDSDAAPGTSYGFTLVEIMVVLLMLGLAAALVAPAIILREGGEESPLSAIIEGARELSVRRGEIIYLDVTTTGEWQVEGAASLSEGALAQGQIEDYEGFEFTLVLSPIGTCGFDVRSTWAARTIPLDPLTCEVRSP